MELQASTSLRAYLETELVTAARRVMLFDARMRLSTQTQLVKYAALDKLIERVLHLHPEGLNSLGVSAAARTLGSPALTHSDLKAAIDRLSNDGRITTDQTRTHHLTTAAASELQREQTTADNRYDRVIARLFGDKTYATPFLEFLSTIFSRLGEGYVRLIQNDPTAEQALRPNIARALARTKKRYPRLDHERFAHAAQRFFSERDADGDLVKWNLGQNYYIAKALGLDATGHMLSRELFGGGTFYLDTNVIIPALEPLSPSHDAVITLSKACKQLGITLAVTQASVNELRRVVHAQTTMITEVAGQIPEATKAKVRGLFYQLHRDNPTTPLDELFAHFTDATRVLKAKYDVDLVDDIWFTSAEADEATLKFAEEIRDAYSLRGKKKSKAGSLHDATILRWLSKERETNARQWIITLDQRLPSLTIGTTNLALTLDAILQWVTPIIDVDHEEHLAQLFAEAVQYRILPPENFFDLKDFLVFAQLECECKELPAEDVEECIRHVKRYASNLDPTNPTDREVIAREISRHFAGPGLQYKSELERLRTDNTQIAETATLEIGVRDDRIALLETSVHQLRADFDRELLRLNEQHRAAATAFEGEKKALVSEHEAKLLHASAVTRRNVGIIITGGLVLAGIVLGAIYGSGANVLQRIANLWLLPTTCLGVGALTMYLLLGRERLATLDPHWKRLLKAE